MKIWQKTTDSLKQVEDFTVGRDREFDALLSPFDVLGSLAHIRMLASVGLLEENEELRLRGALRTIYQDILEGNFSIAPDAEDVHSHIEQLLTVQLGDAGKKIHSARSRNDQVLTDIKLFLRSEIEMTVRDVMELFRLLDTRSRELSSVLLPGYTHLQLAMPSSFGLWLGAYAESLTDDLVMLKAAYDIVNRNPLGSAAGYGSSFPIDREMTTRLLGFDGPNYNVVYAQMGRGRAERVTATGLASVAETLSRLAMDACLYLNQQFGFIGFPAELTTGSSIMPHKKNPDVFELIRSYCNRIKALPNEIALMTSNLPSGYHRDLQLLKEHLFPAFAELRECLRMTGLMISNMSVSKDILSDEKYKYLFSVEEVNRLVNSGVPFRDAYRQVGASIEAGTFKASSTVEHTHLGSIGNPANDQIAARMDKQLSSFGFEHYHRAIENLLTN